MKRPFQVGDEVVVYGPGFNLPQCRYESPGHNDRSTGVVDSIEPNHLIRVWIKGTTFQFHQRQCRRIVKRKRRSVWIATGNLIRPGNQVFLAYSEKAKDNIEYTEFREVVKGKE